MWIETQLKTIIEKAATEFDEAVAKDRELPSAEDGTERGRQLDEILAAQKAKREALWKRLHELEDEYRARGLHKLYGLKESPETKKLAILQYEEQELQKEMQKQTDTLNDVEQPDQIISELRFKEHLSQTIDQLRETQRLIEKELAEAETALEREETVLEECKQIKAILTRKLEEAREPGAKERISREKREHLSKITVKHRAIMRDLINFLHEYYPPHPVDRIPGQGNGDEEEEEMCELKFILEDLMNLAVINPSDPYLRLEKGTYWTPYIETIVKAGIAERHPQDSFRIRLVDFSLRDRSASIQ